MTKKYEQRKEANKKYLSKFEDIKVRVPIGERDRYKAHADARGKSLTSLIVELIEKDIEQFPL